MLRHSLSTADFAIAMQEAARASSGGDRLVEWACDWEIAERLGPSGLIPDASFIYQSQRVELHAFVEIDRGTVNSGKFAGKIERYLDLFAAGTWHPHLPVWPTVLTLTPDLTRARLLKRTTEAVLAHRGGGLAEATEFAFAVQDEACRNPTGRVWITAGAEGRTPLFSQGDQDG